MSHQKMNGARDKKARAKRGASLVIVVCVSAFLVAFALAMVYTAGLMLSQANRRLRQEQSRQLARSFSQVLYGELQSGGTPGYTGSASGFYDFACRFLEDDAYLDYDPNQPDATVYHYQVDTPTVGAEYGTVLVALYKETGEDTELTGMITYGGPGGTDPLVAVAGSVQHATLTVEVTVQADGMSYSYSTAYDQIAYYKGEAVEFRKDDGTVVRWDSAAGTWRENTMSGGPASVVAGDMLSFTVTPGLANLKECQYNKTIREEGDPDGSGAAESSEGVTP